MLQSAMRYKCWRSHANKGILVISREAGWDGLPEAIRHLGPWVGGAEGTVDRLRPHYGLLLQEQGFVVIYTTLAGYRVEH